MALRNSSSSETPSLYNASYGVGNFVDVLVLEEIASFTNKNSIEN